MADRSDANERGIDPSEAAKSLGRLGGLKGGKARAEKLSAEERSEIARKAGETRWAKERANQETPKAAILRATHGSEDHPLKIFNIEIQCYVLDGGTRVITNRGLQRSLGMAESGGAQRIADMMARVSSKGIDVKDLPARMADPIEFRPVRGGRSAFGYEAMVLADICEAILAARVKKVLTTKFELKYAEHCEILVRGFARVGIIALIDEATGYQEDREKQELRKILEAYIRQGELRQWAERFPIDFYREIFRLQGWKFDEESTKRPRMLSLITSKYIYKQLPHGVYDELRVQNPPIYKGGSRKHRHHQFLTDEIGNPHLERQIVVVTSLMRAAKTWDDFKEMFARNFPSELDGPRKDKRPELPDRK